MTEPTPQDPRKERSRTQILDAAEIAFGSLGYDAASVGDIARRAGLTRKTVYNLFDSKVGVAEAVIARNEARAAPLYQPQIDAGAPAIPLLEQILLDSAGWCVANPGLALVALAPRTRPAIAPPGDRPSFQGYVRDCFRLGQAQGVIRPDEDADFMSMILLGIYAQAMITVLAGHPFDPSEIRRIIRVVIEGVGSPYKTP